MPATTILPQIFVAYGFAIAGGVISAAVRLAHRPLCILISFAAGTLLGVTLFAILPESLETSNWWEVLLVLAAGYAAFFVVGKYVHHVCPACAASHFDEDAARRFGEIATLLIIALSIHSTTDGLAITAGHEAEVARASPNVTDWSLLVALCVHKLPEGFTLGALLLGAGFGRIRALVSVAAVEATTPLGGALGLLFLGNVSLQSLGLILALVGGGFLYLAAHAVLGETIRHGKELVVTSFLAGVAGIGALVMFVKLSAM